MAKPATFGKRENEKKKQARRLEKQNRKEERKRVVPDLSENDLKNTSPVY